MSGITGREGTFHALNNKGYGTKVVSGVTPGKGGQDVDGIPVFNSFRQAVAETAGDGGFAFERLREVDLKGIPEPVPLYRVTPRVGA